MVKLIPQMETTYPEGFIIWSDSALLAINKPAGLLTLPDGYDQTQPHLLKVLEPRFGKCWIVHRLDRETSGILLVARSAEAHHLLNDQFSERKVQKTYHALVEGTPPWKETLIEQPLRKNGDRRHRTIVDNRLGKPASTQCRILKRFLDYSLVEAQPQTGYTHQIRSHLAAIGFPLAGDVLYGGQSKVIIPTGEELPLHRVALHALSIRFQHPISGQTLFFKAPYPPDIQSTLDALRAYKHYPRL